MRERVSRYLNFDGNWKLCKWSRKSVDNKVTYRGTVLVGEKITNEENEEGVVNWNANAVTKVFGFSD